MGYACPDRNKTANGPPCIEIPREVPRHAGLRQIGLSVEAVGKILLYTEYLCSGVSGVVPDEGVGVNLHSTIALYIYRYVRTLYGVLDCN